MSINSSLNSTAIFSNEPEEKEQLPPPLPPSPPLPPYRHLPSITSKSEGNIEGNIKNPTETITPKTLSCIELHVPKNTPIHSKLSSTHVDLNSIHKIPAPRPEMNDDEDEGLTVSVDAQDYISGHSTPENLQETNDENCEPVPLENKEIKEEENKEELQDTIPNEPTTSKVKSETNMHTTSSTVFVDMTKLEEGDQEISQEDK